MFYRLEFKKNTRHPFFIKVARKKRFLQQKQKICRDALSRRPQRGTEFYRVQELETGVKLNGKLSRKELFALKNTVK